jgi:hypothetical protein
MSKQDFTTRISMNKGEINTGESNENENNKMKMSLTLNCHDSSDGGLLVPKGIIHPVAVLTMNTGLLTHDQ